MLNQPHGEFHVAIQDNVIIAKGKGPYNQELILEYQQAVAKAIATLSGKPWGILVSLHGESLMTPAAADALTNAVKSRINNGMVACTSVFIDSTALSLQRQQMTTIYQNAKANFALFEDEAIALQWVKQQLNDHG